MVGNKTWAGSAPDIYVDATRWQVYSCRRNDRDIVDGKEKNCGRFGREIRDMTSFITRDLLRSPFI